MSLLDITNDGSTEKERQIVLTLGQVLLLREPKVEKLSPSNQAWLVARANKVPVSWTVKFSATRMKLETVGPTTSVVRPRASYRTDHRVTVLEQADLVSDVQVLNLDSEGRCVEVKFGTTFSIDDERVILEFGMSASIRDKKFHFNLTENFHDSNVESVVVIMVFTNLP